MKHIQTLLLALLSVVMLAGCYYSHPDRLEPWEPDETGGIDSVAFRTSHHYWKGFNFEATDTLRLSVRPPQQNVDNAVREGLAVSSEAVLLGVRDSMLINSTDPLVVADILYVPADSIDSIWVKVARDQYTQGWVSEKALMAFAVADAPISKFIHYFSDQRTIIFVSILGAFIIALVVTMLVRQQKLTGKHRNASTLRYILRQTGISAGLLAPGGWKGAYRSFYPTLLCLTVSAVTTLYCSIQHFVPTTWVEYYFHPTLNPFSQELPPIMQLFVASVWLLVVVSVAVALELVREEESGYLLSHAAGLACVCVIIYLVLTLTVSIYVGYVILVAYWVFALLRYFRRRTAHFRCGFCGAPLQQLGVCPHCGADNI
ncbi:MAG: zinc ribbon domain-containing protein [Alloprevotella sp.]|nr:zinc ribbon domain-containing protein [Alloprevotella sp.]